jgi:monofunctional glycosyltransferase
MKQTIRKSKEKITVMQQTMLYKVFKIIGHSVLVLFNAVFYIFCLYAIVFTVAATYAGYKVYDYGYQIYKEVYELKHSNPEQSNFMQRMLDSSTTPNLQLQHTFVPLDSISQPIIDAVLAAEDAGFYLHPGVDLRAIAAAVESNQAKGRNAFGGSTITQQLAKNLFLSSERSYERKARELVYALLMERVLGKDRILELYLNYAQWGKTIFGIGAACSLYYGVHPAHIQLPQAIRLASVLAKPSRYSPHSTQSIFLAKRRGMIVENLYLSRKVGDEFYSDFNEPEQDSTTHSTVETSAKTSTDTTKQVIQNSAFPESKKTSDSPLQNVD